MSWRTTAVLFVVLVLLGGYVFWQSRQDPEPQPEPTLAPDTASESVRLLSDVVIEDLRRLDIERREDGTAVSFSRDEMGEWLQIVPTTTQVLSPTMDNHANSLLTLTSRRVLSPDANPLPAYGLHNPVYEVNLVIARDTGMSRFTYFVGNETATGDGVYVQKRGDPRVFIVAYHIFNNVANLIDNPPLPIPTPELPPLEPIILPTTEATEEVTPTPPSE